MGTGSLAAWRAIAGTMPMLSAPAIGVASTSIETPRGHASEDTVAPLSPGTEARLSRETMAKTAVASAKAAAETAASPGEVGQWGPVVEWPVVAINAAGPPIPEVRQSNGTLRQLSNASLTLPLYPWLDVAPDGRAFDSGPDQTMRSLNPSGAGAWQLWSSRDSINRTYGSHAMYDVGKILVAGGGRSTNTAEVIDLNGATPTATP